MFSKRVTTSGVFAGLIAGIGISAFLMLSGRDPWHGFAAGFVALCCNFGVTGMVTAFTRVTAVPLFDEKVAVLAAVSRSASKAA